MEVLVYTGLGLRADDGREEDGGSVREEEEAVEGVR